MMLQTAFPNLRAAAREELRGKNLCCWCGPQEACHADVLLIIANTTEEEIRDINSEANRRLRALAPVTSS